MDNTDISEYEKGAVNNMKLMEKVLEEMDSDTEDEIKEMRDSTQRKQEEQRKILTAKRSNTSSLSKGRNKRPATPNSHKLRWSSLIPEEDRRRSFRLQNKPATYFGEDLPVEVFKHSYCCNILGPYTLPSPIRCDVLNVG